MRLPIILLALPLTIGAIYKELRAQETVELVTNGDFKNGFVGWTIASGSVDWGLYGPPGCVAVDLSGYGPGTLQQVLPTTPGCQYQLTFQYAGNTDGPPSEKTFDVIVGNESAGVSYDVGNQQYPNLIWDTAEMNFTASQDSTLLQFQSTTDTQFGALLSNVSVRGTAVPEPSTIVLLGIGTSGVYAYQRRKRCSRGTGKTGKNGVTPTLDVNRCCINA